jgi:cell wall assembly regulator SMI1
MDPDIGLLLRRRDFTALAQIVQTRWGIQTSEVTWKALHRLAFERQDAVVGGTPASPWSSGTWLLWIKNRLDEVARNPSVATDPASQYGAQFDVERNPANPEAWRTFLQRFSDELLETADLDLWYKVPDEAREARWMGFAPATEDQLEAAERRVGRTLPPSLRTFYAVSNGWRATGHFAHDYLPVEEIGWLSDREPHLFQIASEAETIAGPFRDDPGDERLRQYREDAGTRVKRSLVVNAHGDWWLLDPTPDPHTGEWPATCWSDSCPEFSWDVKNFAELMVQELRCLLSLRDGP